MPKKTIEPAPAPLELTDTNEIPVVSVDIDTSYEAMLPDPVPAITHVALQDSYMQTFPRPTLEKLLPITATVFASIALGALILGVGVIVGAGI
jgi:hypothetical protein